MVLFPLIFSDDPHFVPIWSQFLAQIFTYIFWSKFPSRIRNSLLKLKPKHRISKDIVTNKKQAKNVSLMFFFLFAQLRERE